MIPSELEELIRRRAHQIWEQEGCPEGRARIHWLRAEAEFRERVCDATHSDDPASHALHRSPAENLGEVRADEDRRKKKRTMRCRRL
jgi:hypothetical protein